MLLCSAHAGGGDPEAGVIAAREKRTKLKARRTLLGIGPNRVGNPRAHARLRALERADDIAQALIDAPLDDAELGSVERQLAVVRGLDATFPLQRCRSRSSYQQTLPKPCRAWAGRRCSSWQLGCSQAARTMWQAVAAHERTRMAAGLALMWQVVRTCA